MLELARRMWSDAHETVEETRNICASLLKQIQDMAKQGTFQRHFTTTLLGKILDAAIDGTNADMGNIQLLNHSKGHLSVHVQRGFDEPFLEFFDSVQVGQAPCGTALKAGHRVIVPDVSNSPIFSSSDCLEVLLDAGVPAVQSTPLIGKSGQIWGTLSTHYRTVYRPSKKELRLLDYLAEWAAEILEAEYYAAHPGCDIPIPTDKSLVADLAPQKPE